MKDGGREGGMEGGKDLYFETSHSLSPSTTISRQ